MTNTERVENILRVSHQARNSDRELFIIYMEKSGMNLSKRQRDLFRDLPDMQSIGRIRRDLQEQGKYEADPEVNEARYKRFKHVKQNIKSMTAEEALEARGYRIVYD